VNITKSFATLRKRNKVAFTIIVGIAIILFWKGTWGVMDIIFDKFLFQGHLFWSNVAAAVIGFALLSAAGLVLDRLM